jgi:hypothetical protein
VIRASAEPETRTISNDFPSLTPTNPVTRNGVVQSILDLFDAADYLEIGVNKGMTFNALKAATKVAVDPKFLFDHEAVAAEVPGTSFHETTSDDYFGNIAARDTAFDVIYLDGLHTAEQTIRDLLNAIFFLKPNGVVVIDDVFPCSYVASLPDRHETRLIRKATGDTLGAWMGDVYRLVFFVEAFCQQFNYSTVNNNHGQLVMWHEARESVPLRTLTDVGEKAYKNVFLEKETFRFASIEEILKKIQDARND